MIKIKSFKWTSIIGLGGGILSVFLIPFLSTLFDFYFISDLFRYIPDKLIDILFGISTMSIWALIFTLIQNVIIFGLIGLILDLILNQSSKIKNNSKND